MDFTALAAGAVGLAVAAAALAGWYWWASGASRSARSVTQAARRLAQGDLASRAAPTTRQSREMFDAFNQMAQGLQTGIQLLSGERDRLAQVVATMDDGVVIIDVAGQIIISNPAAAAILGLRPEQLRGRGFTEAVHDHRIQALAAECAGAGAMRVGQVELRRPRKFLNVTATPMPDLQAREVLLTIHDYTGVQQAEASQREFVSNVSHELRNPLAAIKAMVETLQTSGIDDEDVFRNFLGRISQDVDRMSKLVNDLLELSRLESGQLPLQIGEISVPALLAEVQTRFQQAAAERGITLAVHQPSGAGNATCETLRPGGESDAPAGLPALAADADRLRQVLINLLENAIRFTPSGGSVTLAAASSDAGIEFRVADTGVGIARERLPHVFERFYKVDRSRRSIRPSIDDGGGTGLGLAIARQIIEAHGGTISAASEEGGGSVFTFTIPGNRSDWRI